MSVFFTTIGGITLKTLKVLVCDLLKKSNKQVLSLLYIKKILRNDSFSLNSIRDVLLEIVKVKTISNNTIPYFPLITVPLKMNLKLLVREIVQEHVSDDGLKFSNIVSEVLKRGYDHKGFGLTKAVHEILLQLVDVGVVSRQEDEDDLSVRHYFGISLVG